MRFTTPLIPLLLLSTAAFADSTEELRRLQEENAELKAQLACVQHPETATGCTPAATPAASPGGNAAPPPAAVPASTGGGSSAAPAAPASTTPALPTPPPGYIIVKAPEPNSETGCTIDLFDFHAPDVPWKHEQNWIDLRTGMSPKDVEHLIGNQHYEINRDGHTIWQYGKCGVNVQGTVVFQAGQVLFWQAPNF